VEQDTFVFQLLEDKSILLSFFMLELRLSKCTTTTESSEKMMEIQISGVKW